MDGVERTEMSRADSARELEPRLGEREERRPRQDGVRKRSCLACPQRGPMELDLSYDNRHALRPVTQFSGQSLCLPFEHDELDQRGSIEVQQLEQPLNLVLSNLLERLADRDTSLRRQRRLEISEIAAGNADNVPPRPQAAR